jgi:hypothetical protein
MNASRREVLLGTGAALTVGAGGLPLANAGLSTATKAADGRTAETLAATLWRSLTPAQKKVVAFPFEHELRGKVDNNWTITQPIAKVFDRDQQALLRDAFKALHAPDHADAIWKATVHDQEGEGFEGRCSVALFGEPGPDKAGSPGKFELVFTGRHVTRRCDGNSVEGAAFGGPIFYGHQAGADDEEPADHPGNAYWFQAVRANQLFQMLDGKQRAAALLDRYRGERGTDTVKLTGQRKGLPGLPVAELAKDQKEHLRRVLADLLAPFRKVDADEVLKLVDAQGLDSLALAYFSRNDLGKDGRWDVWQLEGPKLLWFFRGAPHVHVWAHVRA